MKVMDVSETGASQADLGSRLGSLARKPTVIAPGVTALIAGLVIGLVVTGGPSELDGLLLSGPPGYVAQEPVEIAPDQAAAMGSDDIAERAILDRSGFTRGLLRQWSSPNGGDEFAALVYELGDDHGAEVFFQHSVEDFKKNVRGAKAFNTGMPNSAGFVSDSEDSHFVFLYLTKGRYVFALSSGGRSTGHNAEEGTALAVAQLSRL